LRKLTSLDFAVIPWRPGTTNDWLVEETVKNLKKPFAGTRRNTYPIALIGLGCKNAAGA
jgi:hypothetical protein